MNIKLDKLTSKTFTVAGKDYEVRDIPYKQARHLVDTIRMAFGRLNSNTMLTTDASGGLDAGATALQVIGLLTSEEIDFIEDKLFPFVMVRIEGADIMQPLSAVKDRVFGSDVISAYEVIVRSLCASFLDSLIARGFLSAPRG